MSLSRSPSLITVLRADPVRTHWPVSLSLFQRHHFADKGLSSQSYVFSSSHVWMWKLDHKKGWAPKNWCFRTVLLEKALESPLDSREIQVNPKGNKPWIFIGKTVAEAEAPIHSHLMWRADSLEKILMLGKIEGRRRRGQQRMRWFMDIQNLGCVSENLGTLLGCSVFKRKNSQIS